MAVRLPAKPKPSAAQIAKVRAALKRESAAAIAALNAGQSAKFVAHSQEAQCLQSWLTCYVDNR